ncbi:hypothetical protein M404DRAFT_32617 [Pisolithus tinctorius Marx 270]|uniref:Uncharacterized protein n=1 Tax=Pisolithus tinctorius Marx 270 TaxID=870435 RepID=A0A0C3NNX9_PISTI|nr:hypothetical protein M404DRAFT_32617 [Pisolithus tinctorius Marx 270]
MTPPRYLTMPPTFNIGPVTLVRSRATFYSFSVTTAVGSLPVSRIVGYLDGIRSETFVDYRSVYLTFLILNELTRRFISVALLYTYVHSFMLDLARTRRDRCGAVLINGKAFRDSGHWLPVISRCC